MKKFILFIIILLIVAFFFPKKSGSGIFNQTDEASLADCRCLGYKKYKNEAWLSFNSTCFGVTYSCKQGRGLYEDGRINERIPSDCCGIK